MKPLVSGSDILPERFYLFKNIILKKSKYDTQGKAVGNYNIDFLHHPFICIV